MSASTDMRLDPCLSGTAAGHPLWVVWVCVGSEGMCGCSGGEGGMCVVWMWEEEGCVLLTHEFGIGNEACGNKFDCAL